MHLWYFGAWIRVAACSKCGKQTMRIQIQSHCNSNNLSDYIKTHSLISTKLWWDIEQNVFSLCAKLQVCPLFKISTIDQPLFRGWGPPVTVLLKYGRPVAKWDPSIHRATQGPTIDGPFGDQWILWVLQKMFRNEVDRRFHRCTDIKCPLCLSKMQTLLVHFDWLHGLSRLLIGGLPRT